MWPNRGSKRWTGLRRHRQIDGAQKVVIELVNCRKWRKSLTKDRRLVKNERKSFQVVTYTCLGELFIINEEIPAKVGPYHEGCGTRASCSKSNIHTIIKIAWHAGERNQFWSNLLANFVTWIIFINSSDLLLCVLCTVYWCLRMVIQKGCKINNNKKW